MASFWSITLAVLEDTIRLDGGGLEGFSSAFGLGTALVASELFRCAAFGGGALTSSENEDK